jgi:CPA1 family monovalent cation:H+ antiporter
MQTAYTVLILLMLVSVSRLVGRVIPLPLPLVQIGAGALLAWPTLGLHVALDPELFLFLFLPPCCSPMAGACPSASCGACAARS